MADVSASISRSLVVLTPQLLASTWAETARDLVLNTVEVAVVEAVVVDAEVEAATLAPALVVARAAIIEEVEIVTNFVVGRCSTHEKHNTKTSQERTIK